MITAITISRQLGSLGSETARILGSALGWSVVQRELINQAARQARKPEMALAMIDDLGLLGFKPSAADHSAYRQAVAQVMADLVDQGSVVIVGRAGQAVLHGNPHVLHVRLIAPLEVRCQRIATRHNISPQAAAAQVQASDRRRKGYCRRYYQIDVNDPGHYDLVINTHHLTTHAASELICHAVSALNQT
jgi:cytidylate kinase